MTIDPSFATLASIIISSMGLLVAIVSFIMNYRLNNRDKRRNEQLVKLQLQLHELQLLKEEAASEKRTSSKVEARHVLVGLNNHRIRIANTGGTTVTNVTCEYDTDNTPYTFIQDKEPFERLEVGESFEETIAFFDGSPSKFVITTRWLDADGKEHSRENIITW